VVIEVITNVQGASMFSVKSCILMALLGGELFWLSPEWFIVCIY